MMASALEPSPVGASSLIAVSEEAGADDPGEGLSVFEMVPGAVGDAVVPGPDFGSGEGAGEDAVVEFT